LQEREVERLGSRKSIKLNVRVLATSNRDLKQYVAEGNFREDLYYRLNVFPLVWPALTDRKGDIAPLATYLTERHCIKQGLPVPKISQSALVKLQQYAWPGNVRELDNVIQRALILGDGNNIECEHILLEGLDWLDAQSLQTAVELATPSPTVEPLQVPPSADGLGNELREQEFSIILETIRACEGRRKDVAEKLGISPRTLRYKLAKMRDAGIEIPV
jgi:two-component system response regulator FlrC